MTARMLTHYLATRRKCLRWMLLAQSEWSALDMTTHAGERLSQMPCLHLVPSCSQ
jgi:hypothetical protein